MRQASVTVSLYSRQRAKGRFDDCRLRGRLSTVARSQALSALAWRA